MKRSSLSLFALTLASGCVESNAPLTDLCGSRGCDEGTSGDDASQSGSTAAPGRRPSDDGDTTGSVPSDMPDSGTEGGSGSQGRDTATTGGSDTGDNPTTGDMPPDTGGTTATDGDDPTGSSGEPVEPSCDDDRLCTAAVPDGWAGPVALRHHDEGEADPCGDAYSEVELTAAGSASAASAQCGCSCGAPTGAACGNRATVTFWGTNSTCTPSSGSDFTATPPTYRLTAGESITLNPTRPLNGYWRSTTLSPSTPGTCAPQPQVNIAEVEISDHVSLCAAPEAFTEDGCTDGAQCAATPAAPLEQNLCVWQEGDLDCPSDGPYQTKSLYFREFTDTRACSECTCPPAPVVCHGHVSTEIRVNGTTYSGQIGMNTCGQFSLFALETTSLELSVEPNVGTCTPSDVHPEGEIAGAAPVTVCCAG